MITTEILRLTGHDKDLGGGFHVRRLLPALQRRSVGPFVFFDHFGPVTVHPQDQHDVRPHPHIGLATVTYLFDGAILHRDSLGSVQTIEPGAVNWMTAGRGIVHSERRPPALAERDYDNHGLQLWVALPAEHEEAAPQFVHTPAQDIPEVQVNGATVRVLVGAAFGVRSPVATLSPTLYLDIELPAGAVFSLPPLAPEMAIYAVDGDLELVGGAAAGGTDALVPRHTMAVLPVATDKDAAPLPLQLRSAASKGAGTRWVVVGGAPLDGPRHMWWNFVSSRKERIVQAARDWEAQTMGQVPGETEFIPLPEQRFKS
jgi:redox-sensitive bicupin YhaK (pirin superfamily)